MSYLRYLCLFSHSGVQHILCCVFVLFFFVLLPVSLDCQYLTTPLVFLVVYYLVLTHYVYIGQCEVKQNGVVSLEGLDIRCHYENKA